MKAFKDLLCIREIGIFCMYSEDTGKPILGAAKYGEKICVKLFLNTQILAEKVIFEITDDDSGEVKKICFVKADQDFAYDVFSLVIDTAELCPQKNNGLFFAEICLYTGYGKVFAKRCHDGSLQLSETKTPFQLTVYSDEYKTPETFRGGIVYHIMTDRFFIGGERILRDDALNIDDWYADIPQYPDFPGGDVENNYFYGGNLQGISEKIEYLSQLGVTHIYLCPVFEAYSNHKYDTGNYMKVDESFGGDKALEQLVKTAKEHGISVILDGVFNHTGDDSIYFNRKGKYDSTGAYQSQESQYYEWYDFKNFPDDYRCWWDIKVLPEVNTENKYFIDYICGKEGVLEKYLTMGIGGIRLDVADELSDVFIEKFRSKLKSENSEAVLIGEVWEDASNKIAYGKRRRYFRGYQLDSVMDYPLREGILKYLLNGDAECLAEICNQLQNNYPEFVFNSLMNFLSTHDTERILSLLCKDGIRNMSNKELATYRCDSENFKKAKERLKVGFTLLFTLPGVPSIFYGDEAGIEGGHDPFNRRTFPWGKEDDELVKYVEKLARIRSEASVFADGSFSICEASNGVFCFKRRYNNELYIICANMSENNQKIFIGAETSDLLSGSEYGTVAEISPVGSMILKPR